MKLYTSLLRVTACACLALYGANSVAAASGENSQQSETKANYGDIVFFNSKGEKKCTLSVPETKQAFDFSQSSQSCENNLMASFTLENVPSATFIQFFDNESCSDAQTKDNFFRKTQDSQTTNRLELPSKPADTDNELQRLQKKKGRRLDSKEIHSSGTAVGRR